jgi:hypothetical protein
MTLDVLLAHEDSRQALSRLVAIGVPAGAMVLRYVALFRPGKRQMSHGRVVALIEELLPDLEREAITRNGRDWAAPLAAWRTAIETVLAARDKGTLTLPLKSHGYLYEVIAGLADKLEAQAERETEAGRRGRAHAGGLAPAMAALAAPMEALAAPPATVLHTAPPPVPAYQGPSRYARKVAAEIAARKAAQAGVQTQEGDA